MKFYQLTPMKIDKFQTIYEIIDVFVIFLLFRKYSLYIANKRYRGNYFSFYFLNKHVFDRYAFSFYIANKDELKHMHFFLLFPKQSNLKDTYMQNFNSMLP